MTKRKPNTNRSGFTLIELLIVVAIIGILAAIAVPNFLNAQIRAKYSRVLADMKNISTAIEMYSFDEGRAPIGSLEGMSMGLWQHGLRRALDRLTTPISYMSSIPRDPFMESPGGSRESDTDRTQFTYNCMQNPDWRAGNYQFAFDAGFTWYMFSPGPANTQGAPWPDYMIAANNSAYGGSESPTDRIFEASNGITSEGWIVWTNKGCYP
ncbi:MAG: type II secretion system protein [Candidatus Hinthialibacter sp.]